MNNFNQQRQKFLNTWGKVIYFTQFLRPYWKKQILTILLSQVLVGLSLINPYLTKIMIDDVYKNKNGQLFIFLAVIGGIIFLLTAIIGQFNNYQQSYISKRVNFDLNSKIISGIYDLDLKFFNDTSRGENLYKFNYDVGAVSGLLTETSFQIFRVFPTFLVTFIVVLSLNWKMGIMAFCLGGLSYIHSAIFLKKRRKIFIESIQRNQSVFSRLNEVLSKMYLVKASGESGREKNIFLSWLKKSFVVSLKELKFQTIAGFTSEFVNKIIIGTITCFGGYQIITGRMTLGALTAIMVYLSRITSFHSEVAFIFQQMGLGMISCGRIYDIANEMESKKGKSGEEKYKPLILGPNISFKGVYFYYYPEKHVLKNFNMEIKPRQTVSIVGSSGCGKTSIVNLMLGLYRPISGEILIEGMAIKGIDLEFVRKNIGVALQEPYLWNGTIRENLVYFNGTTDESSIWRVLEEVKLKDAIEGQTKGIDSQLGDDACKFSEGQKQRLALGRALLRRPKLLILDEALSSVDNETASDIFKNIKNNYSSATIVLITHNPHLLEWTDKVIFIRKDKSTVEGGHQDLLRDGEYCNLLDFKGNK